MNSPELDEKRGLPRKRSKVSRACDSCRRKKIRCDAEYLVTLLKVTKVCNNCVKNTDTCTFSRTPLKRGPSKGYIRDLVDRMDELAVPYSLHSSVLKLSERPRLKLVDTELQKPTAPIAVPGAPTTLSGPLPAQLHPFTGHIPHISGAYGQTTLSGAQASHTAPSSMGAMKPVFHRLAFSSLPSSALPIILPPLLGPLPLTQSANLAVPLSTPGSGPISPHSSLTPDRERDRRIQGPLWKVPYEMPGSALGDTPLADSSRRLSVDLISLILTTGLRLRLPSLKPLVSINSELGPSDSDDDYYLVRSRTYSASLLPRNSVLSMLSLNGRINKSLSLNTAPTSQYAPPLYGAPGAGVPAPSFQDPVAVPLLSLEHNLHVYYAKFHGNFPVLPFSEAVMLRVVSNLSADASGQAMLVVQLFGTALNNLTHYQFVSLNNSIGLLRHFLSLYPFSHHGLAVKDDLLAVVFALLVLINYTVLLNGHGYSLGIAMTAAVFNDFKILENFTDLCRTAPRFDLDDIQVYLPRLYLCLCMIDNCYSLSFGCQSLLANCGVLFANLPHLLPPQAAGMPFHHNVQAARIIHELVRLRSAAIFSSHPQRYNSSWNVEVASTAPKSPVSNFASLFVNLIKDKYELYDYLHEVFNYLKDVRMHSSGSDDDADDEVTDNSYDYQLKFSRLIKKLTQSILNFANYISTIYSQTSSAGPAAYDLVNPFFNISYGQSFKLIKTCKLLVESLLEHVNDNELFTRSVKINNDLSISYNLLVSNLNNNLNAITNAKATLNNYASQNSSSQPAPTVAVNVSGLGFNSISLISSKLDLYNLTFNNVPASNGTSNGKRKRNLSLWKHEFMNTVISFVVREDIDGWY